MEVTVYDSFPDMAFLRIRYVNSGLRDIEVLKMGEQLLQGEKCRGCTGILVLPGQFHAGTQRLDAAGGFLLFAKELYGNE